MKLELTIKTDYLPSWGVWEGIRELVQNGRDAEVLLKARLTVDQKGNALRIENDGCTLPHEALLLGYSTKSGNPDAIGQYGEGLKLGILALVRAGLPVKIRSGSEVWVPTIEQSEKFKAKVLTFDITGGRKLENRVRIEVEGISAEIWAEAKWKFRFLAANRPEDIPTAHGTLLSRPEDKGKVFVKGIYASTDPNLSFGYDFKDATLDRDRRMVDTFDFRFKAREILAEAITKMPSEMPRFISALEQNTPEVLAFDSAWLPVPPALAKTVADDFLQKYGEKAVPVASLAESKDLDHLGRKGVVVPAALSAVLTSVLPNAQQVQAQLKNETLHVYGWSDLSDEEKLSLERALRLVNLRQQRVKLDEVRVVDFRDSKTLGLFEPGMNGSVTISLARSKLADRRETLATLIHEVAHRFGTDGDKTHLDAIENIWADIVEGLDRHLDS